MSRVLWIGLLIILICQWNPLGFAQKKDKKKKPEEPKISMIQPIVGVPGEKVKLTIRGIHLDKATAVEFSGITSKTKILNKGKAPVPNKTPKEAGDTQVVVQVELPKDLKESHLPVIVETPKGNTKPFKFLVETNLPVIAEKENNGGFVSAQQVKLPVGINGSIHRPQDVDVFAFTGPKGQQIVIEVLAHSQGSVLDPMVILYDQEGQQLAFREAAGSQKKPRMEFTLPETSTYYLSLIDAQDRGGPTHPYHLTLRIK